MSIPHELRVDNLARRAYEAYCEAVGGKSAITGDPLPAFEDCPDAVKWGWTMAAAAVVNIFMKSMTELINQNTVKH